MQTRLSTRKVQHVASSLDRALRALGIEKKCRTYQALADWASIVGSACAEISYPERIARGRILVVRVLDAAWVQELSMRKNEILRTFQSAATGPVFDDVRFVVSGPRSAEERRLVNQ